MDSEEPDAGSPWVFQALAAGALHATVTGLYVGGLWTAVRVLEAYFYLDNPYVVGDWMFYLGSGVFLTLFAQLGWAVPIVAVGALASRSGRVSVGAVAVGVGAAGAVVALVNVAVVCFGLGTFRP